MGRKSGDGESLERKFSLQRRGRGLVCCGNEKDGPVFENGKREKAGRSLVFEMRSGGRGGRMSWQGRCTIPFSGSFFSL
ncbi:hypothetical protein COLO4_21329 [Corchorus olitorius]|uniref:Uncharacterized protein n=1 Tax=Corchorus olitorius TaxID=93759 RepID=A0A1R3IU01_9ROSI|nr:hypothetical protein COLO4_21329 [Corchorus olitorius]